MNGGSPCSIGNVSQWPERFSNGELTSPSSYSEADLNKENQAAAIKRAMKQDDAPKDIAEYRWYEADIHGEHPATSHSMTRGM
jgi:hypothetical protein